MVDECRYCSKAKEDVSPRMVPSGSWYDICDKCLEKRWEQHEKDEKRLGMSLNFRDGQMDPLDDPWG